MVDLHPLLVTPIILVPVFILGWLVQQHQRNAGWVDVIWALGVALCGGYYSWQGSGSPAFRWLIAAVYLLWFGRLGWHLARRLQGQREEGRYAYMRDWAGSRSAWLFLLFYLMQASWVWIFSLPAWMLSSGQWPPLWALSAALTLLVTAWLGESLADAQLQAFRSVADNQGRTCRQGLWRYSRHPNYFFEWCHWFAYPILGVATAHAAWLWLAPLVMFVFL